MAYDEELASQIQDMLGNRSGVAQVRMFGGLAWLVHGNMAVAVRSAGGLLVRVDPAVHDEMLTDEGAATMVMRGRPWQRPRASGLGLPVTPHSTAELRARPPRGVWTGVEALVVSHGRRAAAGA